MATEGQVTTGAVGNLMDAPDGDVAEFSTTATASAALGDFRVQVCRDDNEYELAIGFTTADEEDDPALFVLTREQFVFLMAALDYAARTVETACDVIGEMNDALAGDTTDTGCD